MLLVASGGTTWAADVPFPTKHTVGFTFGAYDVHTADVDGDGDQDILVAENTDDDILWWENVNGAGTSWTSHTIDDSFDNALSVHAADIDGDGDIDVLGAAAAHDDITWWENANGLGTSWTEHTVDGDFDSASSVYAADVDGDGDIDVLGAAVLADDITWWENTNGLGTSWTEHTVDGDFNGANFVYASDVDGDGDIDVLGSGDPSSVETGSIAWWENANGAGTSWMERTIDDDFDGAFSVHAADVDGDGDLDVLGAAYEADDITWWENTNEAGTSWTEHTIDDDFELAQSVHAADVDGDGDIDVLGAAVNADDITWWENANGLGTSWTEHTVDGDFDNAFSVHAADVDGDGDIDVVGGALNAGNIAWWENKTIHRNAVFPIEHAVDGDSIYIISVSAADVDGDGDLDVLGAGFDDDKIAWWENTASDGTAWTEHTVDSDFERARSVYAADVDGDGDLDVLGAASFFAHDITWWENTLGDGTAWTERTIDDSFIGATSVYAADVDGDGDLDVLGSAFNDDDIAWWENTLGDGTAWTEHTVDGDFNAARSVYAADMDGDGDLDVLGAGQITDARIAWWENTLGDGMAWTEHPVDVDIEHPFSVYAADVDGDGDLDVLSAANGDDEIGWWENTVGDGTGWTKHTVDGAFDVVQTAYAADVDGDGDLDVLGAAIADKIAWWENTVGDGTAWTKHAVDGEFDDGLSVFAADVDGDGDLDVLGAGQGAQDIAWWENRGGQFGLPTTSLVSAYVAPPSQAVALRLTPIHNGRSGDTDLELVTIELLFDDGVTPLSDAQANSAIDTLRFYRDDGSRVFDASDTQVASISPLSLTAGVQTISFVDGDMDVQVPFGATLLYFVVIDFEAGATFNPLRVTHLTESSSTAEDRDHDIPLALEYLANVATPEIVILGGPGTGTGCPADLVLADQNISGTQILQATTSATLGENLAIVGTNIAVNAPTVTILPGTSISGTFSVGNSPVCP